MSTTRTYSDAVAAEVRAMMARHQVRQVDMAAALGMSQPAISDRLRGRMAWSVDEVYAAANVLGCDVRDLLPAAATTGGYLQSARSEWGLAA